MRRVAMLLVVPALVAVMSAPLEASSRNLERCVAKAASGRGDKLEPVKIFKYKFHCYPVRTVRISPTMEEISGRLDHDLRSVANLRPDDRVEYTFVLERGEVKPGSVKIQILRGGLTGRLKPIAYVAAVYYGVPLTPEQTEAALRSAGQIVSGSGWEDVMQYTIARIAQRVSLQRAAQRSAR